jgi:hypothetical protein
MQFQVLPEYLSPATDASGQKPNQYPPEYEILMPTAHPRLSVKELII